MTLTLPKYLTLDGGLATDLMRNGHEIEGHPLWSAKLLHSDPDSILQSHLRFLKAGADVVSTCSYQASVPGFMEVLSISEQEARRLVASAVEIAKKAVVMYASSQPNAHPVDQVSLPLVAGSVGPYGAFLHDGSEYDGKYVERMTIQELATWHRTNVEILLAAGVDLLAFETLPSQKEAEAIVELLKDYPSCRAWLSFSCRDGVSTNHGESFSEAARLTAQSDQIVAVGVNCTHPQHITSLLTSLGPCHKPIVVYPNSGESWQHGRDW